MLKLSKMNKLTHFQTFQTFQKAHLKVVSSLWLEYPLELRTWRLAKFCVDFPGLRDRYDDFVFLFKLPGDVSDEDDVVSC